MDSSFKKYCQIHRMFINSMLLLLLASMLTFTGCDSNSTGSDGKNKIAKSEKRGIAYDLKDPADLEALKNGVSWWYNWYVGTMAPDGFNDDYQMTFIPMLWGGNAPVEYNWTKDYLLAHPETKYLLVLNEPNLTDQANQTPAVAASNWTLYESLINDVNSRRDSVYLVGPAMNWGTLSGYQDPVTWLDAFYSAFRAANSGRDPHIDYLAFHWYDYGLESQLNRLQKYGKKIWITEMANWNPQIDSYTKQAAQMREMVALCESRTDVFRYAWFIGRGEESDAHFTYLFNPTPGELNDLGNLYISLPYNQ